MKIAEPYGGSLLRSISPHILVLTIALALIFDQLEGGFYIPLALLLLGVPSALALAGCGPECVAMASVFSQLSKSVYYLGLAAGILQVPAAMAWSIHWDLFAVSCAMGDLCTLPALSTPTALCLVVVNTAAMYTSKFAFGFHAVKAAAACGVHVAADGAVLGLLWWFYRRQAASGCMADVTTASSCSSTATPATAFASSTGNTSEREEGAAAQSNTAPKPRATADPAGVLDISDRSSSGDSSCTLCTTSFHPPAQLPPATAARVPPPVDHEPHVQLHYGAGQAGSTDYARACSLVAGSRLCTVPGGAPRSYGGPSLRAFEVAIKIPSHDLEPHMLPQDYLQRLQALVAQTAAGHLVSAAVRRGCVLITSHVIPTAPEQWQQLGPAAGNTPQHDPGLDNQPTPAPESAGAMEVPASAAEMQRWILAHVASALGLPTDKAEGLVVHVQSQVPSGAINSSTACGSVGEAVAVNPFGSQVLRVTWGSERATIELEVQHAPDLNIQGLEGISMAYAGGEGPEHVLLLTMRCGSTYLPLRVDRCSRTATGSCVQLAVEVPLNRTPMDTGPAASTSWFPSATFRPLALEACVGLTVVSTCFFFLSVQPQSIISSSIGSEAEGQPDVCSQAEAVTSELEELASAEGAESFGGFLSDLDVLASCILDLMKASLPAPAPAPAPSVRDQLLRAACCLAEHAVRHGLLHLSTQLVHLQSSPAGAALLGPVHYLAHVPGAAADLVAAAADSGSGDMVQHVGEWVNLFSRRTASPSTPSCTAQPAPSQARDDKQYSKELTPVPHPEAERQLLAAAQHQAGLGRAGLARALLRGFKDTRLEAAYRQHQMGLAKWAFGVIMASRFSTAMYHQGLAVRHLGLWAAAPLVLPSASLLAAALLIAVKAVVRGPLTLWVTAREVESLALTAFALPLALRWVQLRGSAAWVAWCTDFRRHVLQPTPVMAALWAFIVPVIAWKSWLMHVLETGNMWVYAMEAGSTPAAALRLSLTINSIWVCSSMMWSAWRRHRFVRQLAARAAAMQAAAHLNADKS